MPEAIASPVNLLACQVSVPRMATAVERDAHVAAAINRIRTSLDSGPVDLVVLPELSSIDYSRASFECLDGLAEPLDGPTAEAFGALAAEIGAAVLFGIARRSGDRFHITQVALGPDGQYLTHYDKLHLANFGLSTESEFFAAGDHLATFEAAGLRFAPIICYDIRFPELARTLVADHGADVILHCGAYGRDESFPTWHAFVTTRAMENQVPVLSLSRAGSMFGGSIHCPPWVDDDHPPVLFPDHDEAFIRIEVDTAETAAARQRYGFLRDRLPSYVDLDRHGA